MQRKDCCCKATQENLMQPSRSAMAKLMEHVINATKVLRKIRNNFFKSIPIQS